MILESATAALTLLSNVSQYQSTKFGVKSFTNCRTCGVNTCDNDKNDDNDDQSQSHRAPLICWQAGLTFRTLFNSVRLRKPCASIGDKSSFDMVFKKEGSSVV
jgi:hypothetical protein